MDNTTKESLPETETPGDTADNQKPKRRRVSSPESTDVASISQIASSSTSDQQEPAQHHRPHEVQQPPANQAFWRIESEDEEITSDGSEMTEDDASSPAWSLQNMATASKRFETSTWRGSIPEEGVPMTVNPLYDGDFLKQQKENLKKFLEEKRSRKSQIEAWLLKFEPSEIPKTGSLADPRLGGQDSDPDEGTSTSGTPGTNERAVKWDESTIKDSGVGTMETISSAAMERSEVSGMDSGIGSSIQHSKAGRSQASKRFETSTWRGSIPEEGVRMTVNPLYDGDFLKQQKENLKKSLEEKRSRKSQIEAWLLKSEPSEIPKTGSLAEMLEKTEFVDVDLQSNQPATLAVETEVDKLAMSGIDATLETFDVFASCLESTSITVHELDISGNTLDEVKISCFSRILRLCNIEVFDVRHCGLNPHLLLTLKKSLAGIKLTALDVSNNVGMKEEGISHLGEIIGQCGIQTLRLQGCELSKSWKWIWMLRRYALNILDISGNSGFGHNEMTFLGETVKQSGIKFLLLRDCALKCEEVVALSRALGSYKLEHLDISQKKEPEQSPLWFESDSSTTSDDTKSSDSPSDNSSHKQDETSTRSSEKDIGGNSEEELVTSTQPLSHPTIPEENAPLEKEIQETPTTVEPCTAEKMVKELLENVSTVIRMDNWMLDEGEKHAIQQELDRAKTSSLSITFGRNGSGTIQAKHQAGNIPDSGLGGQDSDTDEGTSTSGKPGTKARDIKWIPVDQSGRTMRVNGCVVIIPPHAVENSISISLSTSLTRCSQLEYCAVSPTLHFNVFGGIQRFQKPIEIQLSTWMMPSIEADSTVFVVRHGEDGVDHEIDAAFNTKGKIAFQTTEFSSFWAYCRNIFISPSRFIPFLFHNRRHFAAVFCCDDETAERRATKPFLQGCYKRAVPLITPVSAKADDIITLELEGFDPEGSVSLESRQQKLEVKTLMESKYCAHYFDLNDSHTIKKFKYRIKLDLGKYDHPEYLILSPIEAAKDQGLAAVADAVGGGPVVNITNNYIGNVNADGDSFIGGHDNIVRKG